MLWPLGKFANLLCKIQSLALYSSRKRSHIQMLVTYAPVSNTEESSLRSQHVVFLVLQLSSVVVRQFQFCDGVLAASVGLGT